MDFINGRLPDELIFRSHFAGQQTTDAGADAAYQVRFNSFR